MFKDSLIRQTERNVKTSIAEHDEILIQNNQQAEHCKSLIKSWNSSDILYFDERQVELAKEQTLSQLGRLNSLITYNDKVIDQKIGGILNNLNSDKFEEMKPDLGKLMGNLMNTSKERNQNSRDSTVQLVYDFLKTNFLKNKALRNTYRDKVFKNNAEVLELVHIIKGSLEETQDPNHFKDKLQKAFPIMQELLLLSLDLLNGHLSTANNINLKLSGVGEQFQPTEDIVETLAKMIREVTEFDSAVYGMIIMDANFSSALIAKSLQNSNRVLFETVNQASRQSIEAANAYFYLQLAREGANSLPQSISDFIQQFQQYMHQLLVDNLNYYLVLTDDDVMSRGLNIHADPLESIVKVNSKKVSNCLDIAIDRINFYFEELTNGKYASTITFSVFNRTYSEVMLKLGPKMSLVEDYK